MPEHHLIKPTLVAAVGAAMFVGALLISRGALPWTGSSQATVKVLRRVPRAEEHGATSAVVGMPTDEQETGRRYQIPVTKTQPARGPSDALVTIVNWCDFRSKICRDADGVMTRIMKDYDGKVRWVFRHLPTAQEAVPAHFVSQAIFYQFGKFWELRERLLQQPEGRALSLAELGSLARELGVDWDALAPQAERFAGFVGADIRFADQFGVERPLGLFVNGRRLPRSTQDLFEGLKALIEEELVAAQKLVDGGLAKSEVYEKLVIDGYWGVKDDPAARKELAAEREHAAGSNADAEHRVTAAGESR